MKGRPNLTKSSTARYSSSMPISRSCSQSAEKRDYRKMTGNRTLATNFRLALSITKSSMRLVKQLKSWFISRKTGSTGRVTIGWTQQKRWREKMARQWVTTSGGLQSTIHCFTESWPAYQGSSRPTPIWQWKYSKQPGVKWTAWRKMTSSYGSQPHASTRKILWSGSRSWIK